VIGGAEEASIEDLADDWLVRWARWTGNDLSVLGFPSEWVTGRQRSGGGTRPPTVMPQDVALTDKALAMLRQQKAPHWHVIEFRYKNRAPLESLGRRFRTSIRGGKAMLGMAKVALYQIRVTL
jgi:hypothetical protein